MTPQEAQHIDQLQEEIIELKRMLAKERNDYSDLAAMVENICLRAMAQLASKDNDDEDDGCR